MTEPHKLIRIFSENIQRRRKQLGMTQEELAERLNISRQSMSRMERGAMSPKFERLTDIAEALRCPVAELFADCSEKDEDDENLQAILGGALRRLSHAERNSVLRLAVEVVNLFKGRGA